MISVCFSQSLGWTRAVICWGFLLFASIMETTKDIFTQISTYFDNFCLFSSNLCVIFSFQFLCWLRQRCNRPACLLRISLLAFPFNFLQFLDCPWTQDEINPIRTEKAIRRPHNQYMTESTIWQHIFRGKFPYLHSSNGEALLTAAYARCMISEAILSTQGQRRAYRSFAVRL